MTEIYWWIIVFVIIVIARFNKISRVYIDMDEIVQERVYWNGECLRGLIPFFVVGSGIIAILKYLGIYP